MPATTRGRPVENVTRVNVAFPFARIITSSPEPTDTVGELVEIVVAALAGQGRKPPPRGASR